ncbi:hypothetical protein TcasGA2_TC033799 [Tribolium castaneum]|uniref:Ricin B lectin domain-containing protein n=1 Tax=Tribolium castaneum TaxID=7070 RepID=A0A139WEX2_TRICA|nr:hypothetical protein TcasGA2_TC033799 [Tribolium castaneum]
MEKYYILRNPQSRLVLDGTQTIVAARQVTRFDTQLWKVEHVECGKFFIHNKANKGKVLDIERESKTGANILLCEKENGNINQNWYINSDGSIVCANGDDFALDISTDRKVKLERKTGYQNQKFEFCSRGDI